MWRCPTRTKLRDIQEVLMGCCSHIDLCADPNIGRTLCALRDLSATSWPRLAGYLRLIFKGRCCDFSAALGSYEREEGSSSTGGDLFGGHDDGTSYMVTQMQAALRHLFIITTVGAPRNPLYTEERHYIVLHLTWNEDDSDLREIWLHSSHRVSTPEMLPQERKP